MPEFHLYAWGANSHGQLGLGFQSEQCMTPREVDLRSIGSKIKAVKKITGGGGHTLILDEGGRVYSCGLNDRGQIGSKTNDRKVVLQFERINGLENEIITDVACGWNTSMALTMNGEVYGWGSNYYGQLGIDDSGDNRHNLPVKINNLEERIIGLSMGLRHSALVTSTGRVLVSGSGNKGQLGIFNKENCGITGLRVFTHVSSLKDVVEVACGQNHTAALTKSGKVYTWGDNKHGQLGMDNAKIKKINYPTEVKIEKIGKLSSLRVGWSHTSLLYDNKRIITWGRNNYGQLGYREDEKNMTWIPKSCLRHPNYYQLSIASEHNIAIAEDLTVYSWGWNEHGNCGDGSTRDVLEPKKVDIPHNGEAHLVGSGAGHSFAVIFDKT